MPLVPMADRVAPIETPPTLSHQRGVDRPCTSGLQLREIQDWKTQRALGQVRISFGADVELYPLPPWQ